MTNLFDIAPPHQAHSLTSAASADAIKPKFGKNMVKALQAIITLDGATDEEGCNKSGMTGNSYRPGACKTRGARLNLEDKRNAQDSVWAQRCYL